VGLPQRLPDLLLPSLVCGDREGHELLQRHAVLGIDVEQLLGDGGQAQALLHHGWRHEEAGGDFLLPRTLLMQRFERAKLVKWMQSNPMGIFCERVLFDCGQRAWISNDARDQRRL
jgi:hypothetical protein